MQFLFAFLYGLVNRLTQKKNTLNFLSISLGSLALIIPYHFVTSTLELCGISDHHNFVVCFLIFCSYYAIPLLIIIVCYTKLAMHVIQSHRLVLNQMNTVRNKRTKISVLLFFFSRKIFQKY